MERAGFVASRIFPFVDVPTKGGQWQVPGRGVFRPQGITFYCDKPWPEGDATDEGHLKYESEVQSLVAGGRVPNVTLAGTSQWSNHLNSDPIGAADAQNLNIARSVGKIPNTLVVSYPVSVTLRQHPKILYRGANTGILGQEDLKERFGVENLLVARSSVWKNDALLCYVRPRAGWGAVTLGYTFRWESYYDVQLVESRAGFYWVNATA